MTFNPHMLTLAKEARGLTQAAIASHAGVSQSLMSKIENGLEEPSVAFLHAASDICRVPLTFLERDEAVLGDNLVDLFHKKRLTLPAKPLKQANANANMIRLEVVSLLRSLDMTQRTPFPNFPLDEHESPEEIAALVRATWRLRTGPIPNLVDTIEATGTPIVHADLRHEKLSAICMPATGSHTHVIVLNSRLPASAQRFALAHEIGHLTMHEGVATANMEKEANDFAAALLMPAADIALQLRNVRFRSLGPLKSVWKVSLAALIYRAHQLAQITDRHYRTLNMELNKLPHGRKREPGEFPVEVPLLMSRVVQHYIDQLDYSPEEVARLCAANAQEFRRRYLGESETNEVPSSRQFAVVRND